ncbi:hypothetical protein EMPS_05389 [Entomortierella parvispora]|uniref:Uncharacterized protein n=1 Tax=Entomortierella parvispora TaxID=205924 RepID=A0A9P3LWA5_9FUNG|nr:hypothetical protein EMPS_05389 [Entomortierella parvispora]
MPRPDPLREKLAPSPSPSSTSSQYSQDLPYNEKEIEYQDATGNPPDDEFVFEEYAYLSNHKPYRKPIWRQKKVLIGCGVGTVIFLAIFIPLLIVVIIPKVAQLMMNNASMSVVQLNMTQPGEMAMAVSVLATVGGIPSLLSASLEFTQEVDISWENELIGSMTLGEVKVSKGKGDIVQTTQFQIKNTTAFGDFAKVMLSADGFTWTLNSKATIKALGQTIKNLSINKNLVMHGLNNFANVQILGFDLPADAPDGNGALVTISASIPNPSPIGMTLGTITFDMSYKTAYLGRVFAKDVVLVGGQPMLLNLEGQLLKQTDPVHVAELSELISNYLANIPTLASGKGVSVLPDGVNAVSWLTNAIVATTLTVPLKPVQPMEVVKNIKINDMDLGFSVDNPWQPTVNSNSVSADFKIPFNISINITELANATFKLAYQGNDFSQISTAVWNTTASDMSNNKVVFTVPVSPMNIYNQLAFTDFMTSVTQQTSATVNVTGSVQGVAVTSLGTVHLMVPLQATLPLQGINFSNAKPTVTDILVTNGTTEAIIITANIGLQNPSIFSVNMGYIVLQVDSTVNGTYGYVGSVTVTDLILKPGLNTIPASIRLSPKDPTFRDAFISKFMAEGDIQSSIYGDAQTSQVASMIPTLETLTMNTTIPGMTPRPRLITNGNGNPSLGNILGPRAIPFTVTIANPLATVLWIDTMTASAYWEGNYFGGVDHAHIPFAINTGAAVVSPQLALQFPQGYEFALFLVTQFLPKNLGLLTGATVNLTMTSSILVYIGNAPGVGYGTTVAYTQNDIPSFLKIDYSFAGMTKRFLADDTDARGEVPSIQPISTLVQTVEAVQAVGVATATMQPAQKRRFLSSLPDHLLIPSLEVMVGKATPSIESGTEYVAWLEKALRALYPEHQARLS